MSRKKLAVREAVLGLYLCGPAYSRGVRGGLYEIIRILDKKIYKKLVKHGADWVWKKYFEEDHE